MANTTWSTTDSLHTTLSGLNLVATSNSSNAAVRGANSEFGGKFYWEYTFTTAVNTDTGVGIATGGAPLASLGSNATGGCIIYKGFPIFLNGSSTGISIGTISSGSVVGISCDFSNRLIWFRLGASGSWNAASGTANDPVAGTGGISFLALGGPIYPAASMWQTSDAITANFGDTAFAGSVPSGFTSGFVIGNNYVINTQAAVEEWHAPSPDAQVTQLAAEQWLRTNPDAQVTQLALEEWTPVPPPPLWVTQVALEHWSAGSASVQIAVTQAALEHWTATTLSVVPAIGPMITTIF